VELRGADETALRAAGVLALRELLVGSSDIRPAERRLIAASGEDIALRLVRFLGEVLYLYEVDRFVAARATADGVEGEAFDPGRHAAVREIKAVTYHDAVIQRTNHEFRVTLVLDV